jgi:hypothetical protein
VICHAAGEGPKRKIRVETRLNREEARALRRARDYVRAMTGEPCSKAEALRFLIRNWSEP